MSQANNKKRSVYNTTTSSSSGGGANFLAMKKAKSQAVACSLDNKNGLQHHQHSSSMIQDSNDPNDVIDPAAAGLGRSATNLSRKKATPPQPAKKLVIKLLKGPISRLRLSPFATGVSMGLQLCIWNRSRIVLIIKNIMKMQGAPSSHFQLECANAKHLHIGLVPHVLGDTQQTLLCPSRCAKPTLPTNFEENTWATLKSAISAIFLKQPDPCDLEKLYQAVNDLCLHKMGGSLYQRIEKECEAHVSATLQSLVGQSEDLVVFLSLVEKCWQDFCDQMLMIRGIALYLDRTYVKQTRKCAFIVGHGLAAFPLGEAVDRTLLNHLLKMFTALGIYSESFEKPFLERTSEFYATEGVKYMQQSDIRLHEEHERCLLYLDASTRKPLVATAERQLLERHISAILDKGFMMLMDGNRIEDLQRMYFLFLRVNALESLRQALSSYIRRTGQGIVMDEEKDKDMVSCLLEFKASLDTIWEESFSKNEAFCISIKDAFEHLINLRQNRPAELIAKFLDEKLRAGNKGTSEEELEGTLDKVLVLFRFIQGKDVFEAFYKKDLAKRLLLGKSASIDSEKSMISKLKTECGSQFTNKLEGMFKDIELSKEINESFKQSSQARTKLPSGIEMSVHVLADISTDGYSATSRTQCVSGLAQAKEWIDFTLLTMHSLCDCLACFFCLILQDIFKEFYLSKYSGRRLMWQNSLGHCVLKAEFPKGRKELAVSLFQTVVLMLFNDVQKLSFQDIKDSTGIEDKELRRTLQSLACGKIRVLQKSPKGKEVDDDDSFVFNEEFAAPLYRLKVNAIQMKETVEENTSTTERVFQDRQYQIDAAIVRIMKTRKLKFPIKPADLKKRIESLIDREYLERDKNNPQIYNYLA
ncbi:hypothetical protein HYC85_018175 [Camellia sinensis]|uniref:Cullin family profile domain-containing protein n=1 Tax=Camellia sinensis TaxID=4442 RepID=A0A7J7GXH1_CAMSI|nr:hypothetical protein HYC85_018175 [Camellia sinensis]